MRKSSTFPIIFNNIRVFLFTSIPLIWGLKGVSKGISMLDVSHQYIKKGFWHKKYGPGI
jgi:hypothetical protein